MAWRGRRAAPRGSRAGRGRDLGAGLAAAGRRRSAPTAAPAPTVPRLVAPGPCACSWWTTTRRAALAWGGAGSAGARDAGRGRVRRGSRRSRADPDVACRFRDARMTGVEGRPGDRQARPGCP
jgi:hypothetical protein